MAPAKRVTQSASSSGSVSSGSVSSGKCCHANKCLISLTDQDSHQHPILPRSRSTSRRAAAAPLRQCADGDPDRQHQTDCQYPAPSRWRCWVGSCPARISACASHYPLPSCPRRRANEYTRGKAWLWRTRETKGEIRREVFRRRESVWGGRREGESKQDRWFSSKSPVHGVGQAPFVNSRGAACKVSHVGGGSAGRPAGCQVVGGGADLTVRHLTNGF